MYIPRMWFSENERKGFKACTPAGYNLVSVAGWVGLSGWLTLFALLGLFVLAGLSDIVEAPTLWTLVLPPVLGLVAGIVDGVGRALADKRSFKYFYTPDFSSWTEKGMVKTYPPGTEIGRPGD